MKNMKITILSLILLLTLGCHSESHSKKVWNPEFAVNDAKVKFKESGYSSIQIYDNEGETYSGEKAHDQKLIQCVIENSDWNILAYKLESIQIQKIRRYVSIYNTEMVTLRAQEIGCNN